MITLTSEAVSQVKALLESRDKPSEGIRIGVRTKGCSGLSYTLEFVDEIQITDEKIKVEDSNTKYMRVQSIPWSLLQSLYPQKVYLYFPITLLLD
jgi:iron-sulfur cluster assembly accessory protein